MRQRSEVERQNAIIAQNQAIASEQQAQEARHVRLVDPVHRAAGGSVVTDPDRREPAVGQAALLTASVAGGIMDSTAGLQPEIMTGV